MKSEKNRNRKEADAGVGCILADEMGKEPRDLTHAEAVELDLERAENGKVPNTMANYKRGRKVPHS